MRAPFRCRHRRTPPRGNSLRTFALRRIVVQAERDFHSGRLQPGAGTAASAEEIEQPLPACSDREMLGRTRGPRGQSKWNPRRASLLPLSPSLSLRGRSQCALLHRGQTRGLAPFTRGIHSCPQRHRHPSTLTIPIGTLLATSHLDSSYHHDIRIVATYRYQSGGRIGEEANLFECAGLSVGADAKVAYCRATVIDPCGG